MIKSKTRRRKDKPDKPYPEFPLFAHATKRWAKKIRGRMYYFGPWADPEGSLDKYLKRKDDLHAGRLPRDQADGLTIALLCDKFLNSKRHLVDTHELEQRTWDEYKSSAVCIVEAFGKNRLVEDLRPDDFEQLRARLAKKWGPVTLGNAIQRIRTVLKYAADNGLISKPVLYGQGFKRPSQKVLRKARNAKGLRMFEADQLRRILAAASQPLKAMILLGINCGYGNNDCGQVPLAALDLEKGWVNFPRPKTGVNRRCPLWPETIDALKEAIAKRRTPKKEADAGLVFITKYRQSWSKKGWTQKHDDEDENDPKEERAVVDNPISKEMTKLLKELKLHRPGLGFYALRHTLETIGGETDRQTAVDYIMGHAPRGDDMSAIYRERIGDERLKAVTDHVRGWLFKNKPAQGDILPMRKHKHQSHGRKTKNASG